MSESQIFDFVVLALISWMTLRGLLRGMVSQLASLAALVLSWIVATKFSPTVAPLIAAEPPWNKVCAMLILFLGTTIGIAVLKRFIAGALKTIKLQNFDRLLGGVFGLLKGIIICLIITFFAVTLSDRSRTIVFNSVSGTYLVYGVDKVGALIPEDASVLVKKNLDGFRESAQIDNTEQKPNLINSIQGVFEKIPFGRTVSNPQSSTQSNPQNDSKGSTSGFMSSTPPATVQSVRVPFGDPVAESQDSSLPVGTVTPFEPKMHGFPPIIPFSHSKESEAQ